MKKDTVITIKEKSEQAERDLLAASYCLETIANSLFFASERKDQDMTKPASACVEVVKTMIDECIDKVESIALELDRYGKGEV